MTIGKYTQLISSPINRFIFKTLIKISSAKIKKAFLLKEQQSNPVSVCIPCYQMYGKGTLFLNQLLDSLCKQVFKDFEVVISDQSKDSDAIKNCFLTYSDKLNIKYIRHTGASASSNMNNAIKNASYEIVKPLFQDDFLLNPYALYEASLCQTGWGVSSFVHTNKNNSRYFRKMTPSWNDSIIKGINTIGCPSVIYFNKSTATFFDEKLEWLMDCEFYYQLYLLYGEPQISQSIHTCIRLWENSVTHHVTAATKEKEDRYIGKKHKYKPEVFGTSIGNGFSN